MMNRIAVNKITTNKTATNKNAGETAAEETTPATQAQLRQVFESSMEEAAHADATPRPRHGTPIFDRLHRSNGGTEERALSDAARALARAR
jgi:histone H3/H4